MTTPKYQAAAWQTPTGYADTHCRNCDLGWTRTGEAGGVVTVCLLDRELVLAGMVNCDRFERKPLKAAPADREAASIEEDAAA